MTVWKLVENQKIYGRLSWKNLRNLKAISPLLLAFVRGGSVFFALYVHRFESARELNHLSTVVLQELVVRFSISSLVFKCI